MTRLMFFLPAVAVALLGCAASQPAVQPLPYEADLYPLAQTRDGVTVAIDEIRSPQRAERYFGADLLKEGLLPVHVVVSNHGKQRLAVKSLDVLASHGKEVIDALPLEALLAAVAGQHRAHVRSSLEGTIFKAAVLAPGETYRGTVFFSAPPAKGAADRFLALLSPNPESGRKVRVGLTNLDTNERLLFGPFPLAADTARAASRTSY